MLRMAKVSTHTSKPASLRRAGVWVCVVSYIDDNTGLATKHTAHTQTILDGATLVPQVLRTSECDCNTNRASHPCGCLLQHDTTTPQAQPLAQIFERIGVLVRGELTLLHLGVELCFTLIKLLAGA
jgi:hypothetical protein